VTARHSGLAYRRGTRLYRARLYRNPLDLIERNLITGPIIKLGGARAFVRRHGLSILQSAAGFSTSPSHSIACAIGCSGSCNDLEPLPCGGSGVFGAGAESAEWTVVQIPTGVFSIADHDGIVPVEKDREVLDLEVDWTIG
jgi:hypothetical protein